MDYQQLIRENFNYFNENILDKYFIFTLNTNKSIIVKVEKDNLHHLLGIKYSTEKKALDLDLKPTPFYNFMLNNHDLDGLYDLINQERGFNDELTKEEKFVKEKNCVFIDLFEHLLSEDANLRIYKARNGSNFDTDYLHVKIYNENIYYGYIGLKGEETSNYYRFNSIYTDTQDKNMKPVPIYKLKNLQFYQKNNLIKTIILFIFLLDIRNYLPKSKKRKHLNLIKLLLDQLMMLFYLYA